MLVPVGRTLGLLAFLAGIAHADTERKAWKSTSRSDGNRWVGAYRYGEAGVESDRRLGSSATYARFYANALVLGRELPIMDAYAYGEQSFRGMRTGAYLKLAGCTLFSVARTTGIQLAWSRQLKIFDVSETMFLWIVPVTVGASGGGGADARLGIAPDRSNPDSAKLGTVPPPMHLAGTVGGWAEVTVYAGIGFRKWRQEIFLGVEGTVKIARSTLGLNATPDYDAFRGLVYIDFNPLSGEIFLVTRIVFKVWRWKNRKEWKTSLARFEGSTKRVPLLEF